MLGRPGFWDCLMLGAQTRFIARSRKTMVAFCSMFAYVLLVEVFYVFPRKLSLFTDPSVGIQYPWIFANLAVSTLCIVFFTLASSTNPGYV